SNSDAIIEPKGESQDRGGHQYRGLQNHGPEFYRVEVERLGLSVRPLGRLAQDEKRRYAGREARSRGGLGQMTATSLNFALLDANRPEVARRIAAMVQARDAVEHRSWSQRSH